MKKLNEKLNEKLNSNIVIILLFNLCIICSIYFIFGIYYEQIDDYIIQSVLTGANGVITDFTIYLNVYLAKVFVLLYHSFPNINWYPIILLILQYISFSVIGIGILNKYGRKKGFCIYLFISLMFYCIFLMNVQYTSISMLLFISSFVLIYGFLNNKKYFNLIFGIVLSIIGSMFRFENIYIYIIYIVLSLIYMILKKDYKNAIKFSILYLSVFIVCILLNLVSVNIQKEKYSDCLEYNKLRVYFHDYRQMKYEDAREIFESENISENDFLMFSLFNQSDFEVFSKEKLQNLKFKLENKEKLFGFLIKRGIKYKFYFIKEFLNSYYLMVVIYSMLFCICLIEKNKTKNNIIISSSFLIAFFINIVYLIMFKDNLRVVLPIYLFSNILMLFFYEGKFSTLKKIYLILNKTIRKFIVVILLFVCITIILLNYANDSFVKNESKKDMFYVINESLNYMNNNKKNVYIYPTYSMQLRYLSNDIFKPQLFGSMSNIYSLGGWYTYNKDYFNSLEKNNIDNLYKSLIEKSNVYFVDSNIWVLSSGVNQFEITIKYLNEHYFEENINIELNYEIKKNDKYIRFYKLSI